MTDPAPTDDPDETEPVTFTGAAGEWLLAWYRGLYGDDEGDDDDSEPELDETAAGW